MLSVVCVKRQASGVERVLCEWLSFCLSFCLSAPSLCGGLFVVGGKEWDVDWVVFVQQFGKPIF